jgi:para-aminobenzoate synthetase
MVVYRPSILFIDAYDSFTNNIISLLTAALGCSVRVIHIDSPGFETDEALRNELRHYDAVVLRPGAWRSFQSEGCGTHESDLEVEGGRCKDFMDGCRGFITLGKLAGML